MQNNYKEFIKYYDAILSNKEYSHEVNYILKLWKKYGNGKIKYILDLGCGTGNHTLKFAEKGLNILGLDINNDMINIAKKKIAPFNSNIAFKKGDITKFKHPNRFNIIFSFFFVINYIDDIYYMEKFFSGIYRNLKKNGIFTFDTWNGNVMPFNPPKKKQIKITCQNQLTINGYLKPIYDKLFNKAVFHYDLKIQENNKTTKIDYYLQQIYWNPYILIQILKKVGFRDINLLKYMSLDTKVSIRDYKICFSCLK